jgi:hypothetical protein
MAEANGGTNENENRLRLDRMSGYLLFRWFGTPDSTLPR